MLPDDNTRRSVGDVLLVGGTFFHSGAKLVLKTGYIFFVDAQIKISQKGITFPKVKSSWPDKIGEDAPALGEKYFLDQDQSCHWYLIPEKHRDDWQEYSSLDENDEFSWETPHYARRLDGHASRVVFTNPEEL